MTRHTGTVLVDTNVIIECWRISAWKALAGGYDLETVEMCLIETQTGMQRRRPEEQIDRDVLLATLKAVHPVDSTQKASALVRDSQIPFLDAGEQLLWAHALTRSDAWVLSGPDRASLRVGIRLGFRDRLVSLERLLGNVGFKPKLDFRPAYTQKWLEHTLVQLAQLEGM